MIFANNLEQLTLTNKNYRHVIDTTSNMQLVVMSLKPGIEIGKEVHPTTSQFFRIERGRALVVIEDRQYILTTGDSIIVPPNNTHNIINVGRVQLKLYTIYTPPQHKPDLIQKNKP